MSALPLPFPRLPRNKTARWTLLLLWYSKQIVRKVIFNWRKQQKGPTASSVLFCIWTFFTATSKHLPSCNAQHGRGFRKQGQWNAFAQVLLNMKPVASLQLQSGNQTAEKAVCLLKILTLQSACPRKAGESELILRPTEEAKQQA